MTHLQPYVATIAFYNSGASAWMGDRTYGIRSLSPTDNTEWGTNFYQLSPGSVVSPGQVTTIVFDGFAAPASPGLYTFQWSVTDQNSGQFGASSTPVAVTVV